MRTLRLVALSDDGTSVVLAADGPDGEGEKFVLPIDDRLRAAARGDARRLTQIDVDLGTELPPRVIQSRIRPGETPEQVAAASGTRVERIMRFAHPVIQERARVAEQAGTPASGSARAPRTVALAPVHERAPPADRLRPRGRHLGRLPQRRRHLAGDRRLEGRGQVGDDALELRLPTRPSRRPTPRPWTSPRAPAGARRPGRTGRPCRPPRRGVTVVRDAGRADDDLVHETVHDTVTPDVLPADLRAPDDEPVRDVHPATGVPEDDPSIDALLDEVAEHDTVVLARTTEDAEDDDPRARIPAWEDIVFGVRRHR